MRYKLLLFLLLFQITKGHSQGYKEIYFPGVKNLEILVFDFWLEDGGKISDIKKVSEKSTYDNPELVKNLIGMLEKTPFGEYKGKKIRMTFTIKLINPKYENQRLTDQECEKLEFLRNGKFIYTDPSFSDIVVERQDGNQIEKSEKIFIKSQIEWLSNCKYNLRNPEAKQKSGYKKSDIVHVEIIGVLDNNNVIYKSTLNDQVYTGEMKKL
jgi:hypothetical protein